MNPESNRVALKMREIQPWTDHYFNLLLPLQKNYCGGERSRTDDPLLAKQVL